MSITGLVLGMCDIIIVVILLVLLGALIQWALSAIAGVEIPANIKKLYLLLVALVAVVMLVRLILGTPTISIIGPTVMNLPVAMTG